MRYVVAYDIPDDRRRTKLSDLLQDYGERTQYSVFEADLEPEELEDLVRRARALLVAQQDSMIVWRVCAACLGHRQPLGQDHGPADVPFRIL